MHDAKSVASVPFSVSGWPASLLVGKPRCVKWRSEKKGCSFRRRRRNIARRAKIPCLHRFKWKQQREAFPPRVPRLLHFATLGPLITRPLIGNLFIGTVMVLRSSVGVASCTTTRVCKCSPSFGTHRWIIVPRTLYFRLFYANGSLFSFAVSSFISFSSRFMFVINVEAMAVDKFLVVKE